MKINKTIETLLFLARRYNNHVDRKADDLTARFAYNKTVLLFFMLFAIIVLLSIVGNGLLCIGILHSPRCGCAIPTILTIISPTVALFQFHMLRNATYHLYNRFDEVVDKWAGL